MSTPSTEIVRIPFHGTEVLAVDADGQPQIVLRPVIEGLGLDFATQITKLRRRSWACVGQRPMQLPGDTQSRMHVTVTVKTFLMLLATVDENRVPEHVKDLLIAYQREVADAIEAYWTKGAAVKPGVEVGPQHQVPQSFAQALRLAAEQLERAEVAERHVAELEPKIAEQGKELASARPKVTYVETYVDARKDTTTFTVLAKQLGLRSAHQLYEELKARGVVYQKPQGRRRTSRGGWETVLQWLPRAGYENWFKVLDQPDAPSLHNGQKPTTLYVLPPGKVGIAEKLAGQPVAEVEPLSNVTELPSRRDSDRPGGAA